MELKVNVVYQETSLKENYKVIWEHIYTYNID